MRDDADWNIVATESEWGPSDLLYNPSRPASITKSSWSTQYYDIASVCAYTYYTCIGHLQVDSNKDTATREKRSRVSRAKTLRRDIGRIRRSAVALGVRTNTGGTISPGARHNSSRSPRWRVWSSWCVAQQSQTVVCACMYSNM